VIEKRVLVPGRVRFPPREGFSWLDRRFLREHAPKLPRDAILLYFFLAAVSDRRGLSYWKETSVAGMLRIPVEQVVRAREELVVRDLVAHEPPLTQVLSLWAPDAVSRRDGDAEALARVLGRLAEGGS
jgi:hypothetical protein